MTSAMEDESSGGDPNGSRDLHPIFVKDPVEYMQYIGKEICIATEDGGSYTGRCYTIDPVSQSVVLAKFDGESVSSMQIIMGHCVRNIVVLDDDDKRYKHQLDALFKNPAALELSPQEVEQKRTRLKAWLLKNRIPVEVSGDNKDILSISGALFIEPPYEADNCRSTNEIILGRVQGLIKNMPKDVDEW